MKKLIENVDGFQTDLRDLLKKHSSIEEPVIQVMEKPFGYAPGYSPNRSESIEVILADFEEQVATLDQVFNCGRRYNSDWIIKTHATLPSWVEKFFAQIPWECVAGSYDDALDKVLARVAMNRSYNPSCVVKMSEEYVSKFVELHHLQGAPKIVAMPAEFGLRHRGISIRSVRAMVKEHECGLSAFSAGIMLITHPERLKWHSDLWINCAGDEVSSAGDEYFNQSPYYQNHCTDICYGYQNINSSSGHSGSPTFYIPQKP